EEKGDEEKTLYFIYLLLIIYFLVFYFNSKVVKEKVDVVKEKVDAVKDLSSHEHTMTNNAKCTQKYQICIVLFLALYIPLIDTYFLSATYEKKMNFHYI
ncbi:hypothetical protein ACJX0J_010522, partial [Zea mays]